MMELFRGSKLRLFRIWETRVFGVFFSARHKKITNWAEIALNHLHGMLSPELETSQEKNTKVKNMTCVLISFQDRVRSLNFAVVQCCRVDGIRLVMIVNALNPVQGTIFWVTWSGANWSIFFCISTCELWLQTAPIRDLRVALGHVLNQQKKPWGFSKSSFTGNHCVLFSCLVICFRTVFPLLSVQTQFCAREWFLVKVHGAHNSVILFDLFGQFCQIM